MQALVEEQAALRRVATLVAVDPDPSHVFARVCEEVGAVLGLESTNLARFESPEKAGSSAAGACAPRRSSLSERRSRSAVTRQSRR
jgi:GAF domain-containing protein